MRNSGTERKRDASPLKLTAVGMTVGICTLFTPAVAQDSHALLQQDAAGRSSLLPGTGLGSFGAGISALGAHPSSEPERAQTRKLQDTASASGLAALTAPTSGALAVAPAPDTRALMNAPEDLRAASGARAALKSGLASENANLLGKDGAALLNEAREAGSSALLGGTAK